MFTHSPTPGHQFDQESSLPFRVLAHSPPPTRSAPRRTPPPFEQDSFIHFPAYNSEDGEFSYPYAVEESISAGKQYPGDGVLSDYPDHGITIATAKPVEIVHNQAEPNRMFRENSASKSKSQTPEVVYDVPKVRSHPQNEFSNIVSQSQSHSEISQNSTSHSASLSQEISQSGNQPSNVLSQIQNHATSQLQNESSAISHSQNHAQSQLHNDITSQTETSVTSHVHNQPTVKSHQRDHVISQSHVIDETITDEDSREDTVPSVGDESSAPWGGDSLYEGDGTYGTSEDLDPCIGEEASEDGILEEEEITVISSETEGKPVKK